MAESPLKRQREETHVAEDPKRHKSYSQIVSLLEEEEDEPNQDLSSILTTLQHELLASSEPDSDRVDPAVGPSSANSEFNPEEEAEKEKVMRHLLEASDDELGLPLRSDGGDFEVVIDGGDAFSLSDGFWELEDEAANYYALLQSELFM